MTTFLLLLSLILNAAAIFAIILLYLRQNRLVEAEKKQARIIGEIEEIFSAYLLELKEENDKFIETMMKTNSINGLKTYGVANEAKNDAASRESHDKEENPLAPRYGRGISYQAARKAYNQNRVPSATVENDPDLITEEQTPKDTSQDLLQLSFIDQVLLLKKQGLSIEEIARDLDKGKTEIELLLKFRQNT